MNRPPSRLLRTLIPVISLVALTMPAAHVRAIGPDAYGYTAAATTYNFEDLTDFYPNGGATAVLDNVDDATVTIPIGFTFVYYGVAYNSVSISDNGMITFDLPDNDWVPVDFLTKPTTGDHPSIAPFFHDWTFQYFGSDAVYYMVLGQPGARRLIIQWDAAQSYTGPGADTVTFEVKLFEGSNNIEFHYMDATITDDSTNSNGRNATVATRDEAGQTDHRVLEWFFNKPNLVDLSAIKYVAPTFKVNAVTRLSNKHAFLQCTGAPSSVNTIEATTSLASPFATLGTAAADSLGHFTYEDAAAATMTQRFYRVAVP